MYEGRRQGCAANTRSHGVKVTSCIRKIRHFGIHHLFSSNHIINQISYNNNITQITYNNNIYGIPTWNIGRKGVAVNTLKIRVIYDSTVFHFSFQTWVTCTGIHLRYSAACFGGLKYVSANENVLRANRQGFLTLRNYLYLIAKSS